MRKWICVLLAVMALLSCLDLAAFAAEIADPVPGVVLRAGGGSSGGGGGGGSSGGSSGSHRSRRQSPLGQFVSLVVAVAVSTVVFRLRLSRRARIARRMMKQMQKSDNAWKFAHIKQTVTKSFYAIQWAWGDLDMTPAAEYLSESCFRSFQSKLNWMKMKNEQNILKRVRLLEACPVDVYDAADNDGDYVWFYIRGRMVDYTVRTDTGETVSGSYFPASFEEFWKYVRNGDTWVLDEIQQKDEGKDRFLR